MGVTGLATTHLIRPHSHSLIDSSEQHELKLGHTPLAGHCIVPGGGTLGYFSFIHYSLIVTYVCFAL